MKKLNLMLTGIAAVAFLTLGIAGTASAFHLGGVAYCEGCHTMHGSAGNPNTGTPNTTLLKGTDASSTCLTCHGPSSGTGYHIMSPGGTGVSQGGDFYWINKDYAVVVRSNTVTYSGDDHGHNIIAADFAMTADSNPANAQAPGGTYPNAALGCNSCHNPHGQVAGGTGNGAAPISASGSYGYAWPVDGSILGNYRLLPDPGYVAPGGLVYTSTAPIARAYNGGTVAGIGNYGASVDYGSGMSEFCASCHTAYIGSPTKHPAGNDESLNGEGTNYNSYVATGNFTGTVATAFDPLVPFERGVTDKTTTATALSASLTAPTLGTDANSNVMCLTCHRAHASAHADAGKWDFEVELLDESHALNSPDVNPATQAVYYGRNVITDVATKYGPWQRQLCNKCHVKD